MTHQLSRAKLTDVRRRLMFVLEIVQQFFILSNCFCEIFRMETSAASREKTTTAVDVRKNQEIPEKFVSFHIINLVSTLIFKYADEFF